MINNSLEPSPWCASTAAPRHLPGTPAIERQQLEDRFKRELKLARQVTHPNVVRIHDLGEVDGTLYFTMEYVQGSNLATLLERKPELPLTQTLGLARQIASGLAAASAQGGRARRSSRRRAHRQQVPVAERRRAVSNRHRAAR